METRGTKSRFKCKCTCGKQVEVLGTSLQSGKTRSCGCLKLVSTQKAARNQVLSFYKRNAKDRGLEFYLSDLEFDDLIFSRCFYCDSEPTNKSRAESGKFVMYNGIDRLDSNLSYITDNCVPCCKTCNMMKKRMSLCDFVTKCKKIAETFNATDIGELKQ